MRRYVRGNSGSQDKLLEMLCKFCDCGNKTAKTAKRVRGSSACSFLSRKSTSRYEMKSSYFTMIYYCLRFNV